MLNLIWAGMLIGGIVAGAISSKMDVVTQGVLSGGKDAIQLVITMAGVIAMWSGILKIGEKAGMMEALAKKLSPLLRFLFPDIPKNHPAMEYIAANFAANFLGLGWAATPAGLRAMEELQTLNHQKNTASNAMCMFLIVNMSSLQLVTMNILAYRTQYGSQKPAEIVGPGIAATLVSTVAAIFMGKLLEGRSQK